MAVIGSGISLRGMVQEDWYFPMYLSGTVVAADVGKAVSLTLGVNNTVHLSVADEQVFGQLEVLEARAIEGVTVGTIANKGPFKFSTTGTVNVGQSVSGSATVGSVKAATAQNLADNIVVEVGSGYAIVLVR